jgi:ABC-type transport system substrate-binding protein
VAVIALALLVGACGGGGGGATKVDGKAGGVVVAELGEPDGLAPYLCATTSCSEPGNRIYDALLEYDWKTAEVVKTGAATDYTVSADATKVTYQLRKDAKFHNGEPVTAESFVRALTLASQGKVASELAYHLDGIKGWKEAQASTTKIVPVPGVHQGKDAYELVIELEKPNAEFYIRTGHLIYSPIPKAAVNADGTPNPAFNEQPIGNGPYKVAEKWKHKVELKLTKYADYNGVEKGFLDGITFKIFEKLETAYLEFQATKLDTSPVTPELFAAAAAKYGKGFLEMPTVNLTYVVANTTAAPTDNVKFRQALSLAIDRKAIVKTILDNRRVPATSIVPPQTVGHRPNVCEFCKHDPVRAKQLLTEAGGPKNITITFNSGAGHEEWTAEIASQLKTKLGITAKLVGKTPFGDYLKFIDTPAFGGGLARLGWVQDYPTPDNWLFPLLYSKAGDNHSHYNNPTFDAKITAAQTELDAAKRLKLQQEAEDIALQDMPILPLWYGKSARVYTLAKFKTFPLDLQSGNPYWELVSLK